MALGSGGIWAYRRMFRFVFSSWLVFVFLIHTEEICSSEMFRGRMKNRYFCSINILGLFSFNVAEIPRAVPGYSTLSLINPLDCLHPFLEPLG